MDGLIGRRTIKLLSVLGIFVALAVSGCANLQQPRRSSTVHSSVMLGNPEKSV